MLRLMLGSALALLLTTVGAAPAHAAWDFTWLSSWQFFFPDGDDVNRQIGGTSMATIAPEGGGLRIDFDTPVGPAAIHVQDNLFTIGDVPHFAFADSEPGIGVGSMGGSYDWTGPFTDPDTFTVALSSGPSGPSFGQFSGTGTRQTAEASEPAGLLLVGLGLAVAVARRRARV